MASSTVGDAGPAMRCTVERDEARQRTIQSGKQVRTASVGRIPAKESGGQSGLARIDVDGRDGRKVGTRRRSVLAIVPGTASSIAQGRRHRAPAPHRLRPVTVGDDDLLLGPLHAVTCFSSMAHSPVLNCKYALVSTETCQY